MQGESLVRPSDDASIGPLGKGVLPGIRVTSSAQFLVPLSLVQYLGGQDCKDNDFVEDSTVFPFFFVPFRPFFLRERFVSRFSLRKYRPFWSARNDVALVICFFFVSYESHGPVDSWEFWLRKPTNPEGPDSCRFTVEIV